MTRKTAPKSFEERIRKINDPSLKGELAKQIQRGWLNYFRGTSIQGKLRDIDGWLRNRLRYCIWTDWKKAERKRKNLMRLGIDKDHAYAWSRTRNAPHSRIPKIQYQSVSKRRLANRPESDSNHYNYPTAT
ncbi:group II intron maturase-specific domain-containing protein [Flavobacterium sp. LS1P28]|uniref:group II intron maturase-specific domain-containing protein n=1 Tax=Flavobacterium sp. LS1P28 TaxID=2497752 RepID=UPI001F261053|nr:group II intron maturase-specific domain-containing protein [Flavobacterium sp. LS1P28]